MSDGRLFTDYRTSTRRDEYIKYINNIIRNDEYRIFLQKNADTIMNDAWDYDKKYKSCWVNECVFNYPTRVYPPWFVQEMHNYNQLQNPNRTKYFPCPKFADYRMTDTYKKCN